MWRSSKPGGYTRSEEHTSELQSPCNLVCRLLLEKKKKKKKKDRKTIGSAGQQKQQSLRHLQYTSQSVSRQLHPLLLSLRFLFFFFFFFFLMIRRPPKSTLFPYRPLFR